MDESEREKLKDGIKGTKMTTSDLKGNMYPMTFKIWGSKTHVLTAGWKKFYLANKLKALEDWITIWMFRHNQTDTDSLYFAIMARRFAIHNLLSKSAKATGKKQTWRGKLNI
ncbi:hypothetical protein ACSBR1_039165 [Camellia fascicularis]